MAAIAIPRLSGFQDTAKLRTNISNTKMVQNAVRVYQAETGNLPTAIGDLQDTKYLGETAPVPVFIKAALSAEEGYATTGNAFVMDTDGVVSIGVAADGLLLSGTTPAP